MEAYSRCGRTRLKYSACLIFMFVPIVKFRLIIFKTRIDFERVLARCRSHDNELSSSTPRYELCSTSDRSSPYM